MALVKCCGTYDCIDNELVIVRPMLERVDDWLAYLSDATEYEKDSTHIERHTRTGRPLGDEQFVTILEAVTGRELLPKRPGRPVTDRRK